MVADRYRLEKILGRGGMGAVWHGYDLLLDRDVAVKEIYLPGADHGLIDPDDPRIRRAIREARAAAGLRHPNIVTVHDVALDGGRPWIIMELVDGPSLAEVITKSGALSSARTAEIGLQVLDALSAAHRRGTVHRDVKPANILIDTDRAMLTDFGIAAMEDASVLTMTGHMLGSPAYMAPERINGDTAAPAADLWALGVTLYTAATGRSPFPGEDTQSTIMAILTRPPPMPVGVEGLWPVLAGLLEKDPARRLTPDRARPLLTAATRSTRPPPTGVSQVRLQETPTPSHQPRQRGMLPAHFPVQLVGLTVGNRTGYTLRTYVPNDDGWARPVFTSAGGKLLLMPRPEQAAGFALSTPEHDLAGIPQWNRLRESMSHGYLSLLDANRYDLSVAAVSLEMDPARWLPDLMVRSGTIARELMLALDIKEAYPFLGAGAPLDRFDGELRQAGVRPHRRHIKRWQHVDRGLLAGWWQSVNTIIGGRLDWKV